MPRLILLNKPFGVLTQFTSAEKRPTLADFVKVPGVYPAGRLDHDSEGLIALTDQGWLQHAIAEPKRKLPKTYYAQVEGLIEEEALESLRQGVTLKDGLTLPANASLIQAPDWLWPREPPIRIRKSIPDGWLSLTLTEGRNRQVRRMTAAVGLPTLRLIRWSVGPWTLKGLEPGQWREIPCPRNPDELRMTFPV